MQYRQAHARTGTGIPSTVSSSEMNTLTASILTL
jgi:hypothetical protein